jgi:hypothetical protein
MDDMMDEREDPKFEQWLAKAAQSYNAPRRTPNEEMWARIHAARRTRRVVAIRPWLRWSLAAAAVLVLGIGIGRWSAKGPSVRGAVPTVTAAGPSNGMAYRVAAQQYFTRTEVLLTEFRSQQSGGRLDPQFLASARDLLMTTRLLLDSPAADDARLKPLLEDLELVLAQITQLQTEPGQRSEMDLINQGMNQHSVLTRLRESSTARAQGVL